jgi:hypothetical protein
LAADDMTLEKAKKRGRPSQLLQMAELHAFVEFLLEKILVRNFKIRLLMHYKLKTLTLKCCLKLSRFCERSVKTVP